MNKNFIEINRFDLGLNTKVTPQFGLLEESPDCDNVIFDEAGAVATRNGFAIFNTAVIASAAIDKLGVLVNDSDLQQMVAVCNGSIWATSNISGTSFITIGSAQSIYTIGQSAQMLLYDNHLFISNGYINPYKYNGTEFTRWGVPVCSACTGATTSAGTLTGTYKYVILGVNSNLVQGNYGSASTGISALAEQIYLTEIPIFPTSAGVNNKAICRNTADASGVYYVLTQIANATTTYIDNIHDDQLDSGDLAPLDNGLPPKFTCMVSHLNYIFGASSSDYPHYLWYSVVNEPETFPTANYIRIGEGDGLKISALGIYGDNIIICKSDTFGNSATYMLYMPSATYSDWSLKKLDITVGSEAVRVMERFGNWLALLNRNGVYDLNQISLGLIQNETISYKIEDEILAIADTYISKAVAINWKNKLWLSIPSGSVTANNRILVLDYVRGVKSLTKDGAWTKFTGMNIADLVIFNNKLYGASSGANGYVYELDTGTNDNSTAIDSYYKTMILTAKENDHADHMKVWRELKLLVECSGAWFLNVEYSPDFNTDAGTPIQVNLEGVYSEWGLFDWGEADWGVGENRKWVSIKFPNLVSTSIQLKFSTNTADQYFKIHKAKIYYNLRGVR